MAFRFLISALALCLSVGAAFAQTAQQVVTGYLSTSGCPSVATTPCFVPFGSGGGGGGGSASPTNISGSITTGGSAQNVVAAAGANAVRHIIIQNISADPECFSFFTTTPSCGSAGTFVLKAASGSATGDGGSYTTPPGFSDNNALYIIGATTGDGFTAAWQ